MGRQRRCSCSSFIHEFANDALRRDFNNHHVRPVFGPSVGAPHPVPYSKFNHLGFPSYVSAPAHYTRRKGEHATPVPVRRYVVSMKGKDGQLHTLECEADSPLLALPTEPCTSGPGSGGSRRIRLKHRLLRPQLGFESANKRFSSFADWKPCIFNNREFGSSGKIRTYNPFPTKERRQSERLSSEKRPTITQAFFHCYFQLLYRQQDGWAGGAPYG